MRLTDDVHASTSERAALLCARLQRPTCVSFKALRHGHAEQHSGTSLGLPEALDISTLQVPWLKPMSSARLIFAIVLIATVGVAVPAAHAEELPSPQNQDAVAHLNEGNKAYRLKDFDLAVREYRAGAAVETGPVYTFWYNLGQAYRQLGRYEDAIWFYRQFLNAAPITVPMHRDAATGFIEEMQRELDQAATKSVPTEPAPTPLIGPTTPAPRIDQKMPAKLAPWYSDSVGWVLVGGGTVATTAAVLLLLKASSAEDEANAEPVLSRREELRDSASTWRLLGGVSAAVGAGLVISGVVKLAIKPSRTTEVTVAPTGGGLSLAVGLRF